MNDILKRLRTIIETSNLSDSAFAKRIGLSQSTFSNLFQRDTVPRADAIAEVVNQFGVNANWLLLGTEPVYLSGMNEKQSRHQEGEDFTLRKTFPGVYKMWEENRKLSKNPSGNGCELCDILHSLDDERKTKLKGYAEALQHEQILTIKNESNHR